MKKIILAITIGFSSFLSAQQSWSIMECIEYAAKNNLTIQQNELNVKLAEKNLEQANNNWLPTVSGYFDNNINIGSYHPVIEKGYYQFSNSFGVQSQVNLYSGGIVKLQKEKSTLDLEASKIETLTTLNDISLQVANYYLAILLNRELKSVAEGNLDIAKQLLDQARKKFNAGTIARAELVQAEAEVASNIKNITDAQIEIDRSLFNLAMLLQLQDYRDFNIKNVSLPDTIEKDLYNLEDILNNAYATQPVIKLAEVNIESAKKATKISETYLKPRVTGNYSLGTNYMDYFNKGLNQVAWLSQWRENIVNVIGVSISFPIWNQYSNRINIQKSLINEDIALNNFSIQKQQVLQNVQSAYFEVNSSFASFESAREAVRYAEISFDFAQKSYNAGIINLYDFNRSRNDLLIARSQMLQAKYNFIFKTKVLDFYAGIPIILQ
ncbi:TolC family protein [Faecalibacter rhinopitheci]|uniref:TolC family protein n=1 Tax=Faecalibacter rhinopitheci TaxID=2779678 RepID=A0A8J7KD90_9FLAO|nr:TolC family protein [Faecalibacter rhinopitheci]MBF0597046.1 TolC family protein [Faecalibacter rhinopitheci]MBQ0147691.1 TolC family protein [Candidatus Onthonaster equi]